MGSCLSLEGLAISVGKDVDAPLEVIWDTITDVPNYTSYLSNVENIELLCKKGGKLKELPQSNFEYKEGALWRETSNLSGVVYVSIESITCIKEVKDDNGVILSRAVGLHSQLQDLVHQNSTHTSTHSIQRSSSEDNNKWHIQVTMAFLPVGCCGVLDMWRRGKEVRTWAESHLQKRINEYAAEAERRHKNNPDTTR